MTRSNRLSRPLAVLVLTGLLAGAQRPTPIGNDEVRLAVRESSRLWIEGDSNLHAWHCDAPAFTSLLRVDRAGLGTPPTRVIMGRVTVPVARIECGSGKMNENLRKAMRAGEHPAIEFQVIGAEFVDTGDPAAVELMIEGNLTVAGASRPLRFQVSGTDLGDGSMRIQGRVAIRMTDHGVQPPTALLGMLKTADPMTIHFDLVADYELQTEARTLPATRSLGWADRG